MRPLPCAAALLVLVAAFAACSGAPGRTASAPAGAGGGGPAAPVLEATRYVEPGACADCHADIAETFAKTAMGQSFQAAEAAPRVEDFVRRNVLRHEPSGYTYAMRLEDRHPVQARYEVDSQGRRVRLFERRADFIVGSGRHARTYLHRSDTGELTELPVSWYPLERRWGMSPGYDRPDHSGFTRPVTYSCLFCHNAYPQDLPGPDSPASIPLFPATLPSGIDCQRCHGPGSVHIEKALGGAAPVEEVRAAIVNPARLAPERRMDVCMQCHLETTSGGNWSALVTFGRGIHSFRPGQDLAAYKRHFDQAPGQAAGDRFEIAHQAYRLRQSACFIRSEGRMTCVTCHDPHRRPDDSRAHYAARCLSCHRREDCGPSHASAPAGAAPDCAACHMPPRRTDDVVHVVMTDHLIRRRHPEARERLAPRAEDHALYRGPIAFYRPEEEPPGPERDLYLAVAGVIDGIDRGGGLAALERALDATKPAAAEPWLQAGITLLDAGRAADAAARLATAQSFEPGNAKILMTLGNALAAQGRADEALRRYDEAIATWPLYAEAHTNAGNVLFRLGRYDEALRRYDRALAIRDDRAEAHSNRGAVLLRLGRSGEGEAALLEALRIDPAHEEASLNLATALQQRGARGEAIAELRRVRARKPRHPGILARLAWLLATAPEPALRDGPAALAAAEEAVRLSGGRDPRALDAIAAALAEAGRFEDAARGAERAARAAGAAGQADLARAIEARRDVYRSGRPYRDGP